MRSGGRPAVFTPSPKRATLGTTAMAGELPEPAVKPPGTPFWDAVAQVFQKLKAMLPGNLAY